MAELSARNGLVALDADTLEDVRTGKRIRVTGVDAFESGTPEERAARQQITQRFLDRNPGAQLERRGQGFFGRDVADVVTADGQRLSHQLAASPNVNVRDFTGSGGNPTLNLINRASQFENIPRGGTTLQPRSGVTLNAERGLAQEFGAGVRRGTDTLQAGLFGGLAAVGDLIENKAKGDARGIARKDASLRDRMSAWLQRVGDRGFMRNVEEAARSPASEDFKEALTGDGNLLGWAFGALGEAAPSLAGLAAGAGVGGGIGLAGRAAANRLAAKRLSNEVSKRMRAQGLSSRAAKGVGDKFIQNLPRYGMAAGGFTVGAGAETGHIFEEAKIRFGDASAAASIAGGSIAGALDLVGARGLLKTVLPGASTDAKRALITRMLQAAGIGTATEGLTEAVQEAVNIIAVESQNPDDSVPLEERLLTEENGWQLAAAAAAGGLFGGAVGASGRLTSDLLSNVVNSETATARRRKDGLTPSEQDAIQPGNQATEVTDESSAAVPDATRADSTPDQPDSQDAGGIEAGVLGVSGAEPNHQAVVQSATTSLYSPEVNLQDAERQFEALSVPELVEVFRAAATQRPENDPLFSEKFKALSRIGREKSRAVTQITETAGPDAQPSQESPRAGAADRPSTEPRRDRAGSRQRQPAEAVDGEQEGLRRQDRRNRSAQRADGEAARGVDRVGEGATQRTDRAEDQSERTGADRGVLNEQDNTQTQQAQTAAGVLDGQPGRTQQSSAPANRGVPASTDAGAARTTGRTAAPAGGAAESDRAGIGAPGAADGATQGAVRSAKGTERNRSDREGVQRVPADARGEVDAPVAERATGRTKAVQEVQRATGLDEKQATTLAGLDTITVPKIAKALGVKQREAAAVRQRLVSNGNIKRRGRNWVFDIKEAANAASTNRSDGGTDRSGQAGRAVADRSGARASGAGDAAGPAVVQQDRAGERGPEDDEAERDVPSVEDLDAEQFRRQQREDASEAHQASQGADAIEAAQLSGRAPFNKVAAAVRRALGSDTPPHIIHQSMKEVQRRAGSRVGPAITAPEQASATDTGLTAPEGRIRAFAELDPGVEELGGVAERILALAARNSDVRDVVSKIAQGERVTRSERPVVKDLVRQALRSDPVSPQVDETAILKALETARSGGESLIARQLNEASQLVGANSEADAVVSETDLEFAQGMSAFGDGQLEVRHYADIKRKGDKQVKSRAGWKYAATFEYRDGAQHNPRLAATLRAIQRSGSGLLGEVPRGGWAKFFESSPEWRGLDVRLVTKLDDIAQARRDEGREPGVFYLLYDADLKEYYIDESFSQGTFEGSVVTYQGRRMPVQDAINLGVNRVLRFGSDVSNRVRKGQQLTPARQELFSKFGVTFTSLEGMQVTGHAQRITDLGRILGSAVVGREPESLWEAFHIGLDIMMHRADPLMLDAQDLSRKIISHSGITYWKAKQQRGFAIAESAAADAMRLVELESALDAANRATERLRNPAAKRQTQEKAAAIQQKIDQVIGQLDRTEITEEMQGLDQIDPDFAKITEDQQAVTSQPEEGRQQRADGKTTEDEQITRAARRVASEARQRRKPGSVRARDTKSRAYKLISELHGKIKELQDTSVVLYDETDISALIKKLDSVDTTGELRKRFEAKRKEGNATSVVFNGDQVFIYIDSKLKDAEILDGAAHEMGHVVYRRLLKDEYNKHSEIWQRIAKGWQRDTGGVGSVEEWFADQVAVWARKGRRPENLLERMFKRASDAIGAVWSAAVELIGHQRWQRHTGYATVEAFMDGLIARQTPELIRRAERLARDGVRQQDPAYDFHMFQLAARNPFWSTSVETDIAFMTGADALRLGNTLVDRADAALAGNRFTRRLGIRGSAEAASSIFGWMNNKLVKSADGWLRTQDVPVFQGFADLMYRRDGDEVARSFQVREFTIDIPKEAFFDAVNREYGFWSQSRGRVKGFEERFKDLADSATFDIARQRLQSEAGVRDTDSAEVKEAVAKIRELLDEFFNTYLKPKLGDRAKFTRNFFPRVYDVAAIKRDIEGFHKVLTKHLDKWGRDDTEGLIIAMETGHSFIDADSMEVLLPPGIKTTKARGFAKIPSSELQPYMSRDVMGILRTYFHQTIKRAEWEQRMPLIEVPGGKIPLDKLIELEAKRQGANEAQITEFRRIHEAYLGRLGADLDPGVRRTMSVIQTYQNVRLLPFAVLSSLIDLANPTIRSHQGLKASWTSLMAAMKAYKDKGGSLWDMAATHGLVNDRLAAESVSQRFNAPYLTEGAQRFNEKFFRAIGMNQWTNFSRLYALEMGKSFLIDHATKPGKHSERWLKELGVDVATVKRWIQEGKKTWLVDTERSDSTAQAVQLALNRFVQESVFLPNAAQRPSWASDPKWMLVWHLKQFVWSFTKVILGRAFREMKKRPEIKDKLAVALPFVAMMPLAMLGLTIRDWLKWEIFPWREGQPEWQRPDTGEWVWDAMRRSGVLGPLDILLTAEDVSTWGGFYLLSFFGPTANQVSDSFSQNFSQWFLKALPGFALLPEERAMLRNLLFGDS